MINQLKIILTFIFLVVLLFGQQNTVNINKKKIEIGKTDILFKVKGMVCSFCAQGLQKNLSKLSYIDKKNYTKGVKVSLKDQITIISTKEGAKIDYDLAVKKIVDAGYNVEKAYHNPTGLRVEQVSLNASKQND